MSACVARGPEIRTKLLVPQGASRCVMPTVMLTGLDDRDARKVAKALIYQGKAWRAQEDLNPRTRIRSPLLYPG